MAIGFRPVISWPFPFPVPPTPWIAGRARAYTEPPLELLRKIREKFAAVHMERMFRKFSWTVTGSIQVSSNNDLAGIRFTPPHQEGCPHSQLFEGKGNSRHTNKFNNVKSKHKNKYIM
jgi:hypothetical protein